MIASAIRMFCFVVLKDSNYLKITRMFVNFSNFHESDLHPAKTLNY